MVSTDPFEPHPTDLPGAPGGEPSDGDAINVVEVQPVSMEERFASLEESNKALASDVRALTTTLQVVNELQIEQRSQSRRQTEMDAQLALTKQETEARLARTRRSVTVATLAMAVLLPVVSIIVYTVLIAHVNDLLDRNSADRRTACDQRNEGTMANVRRERLLASIETDEQARRIHTQSADEIESSLIDCDRLYTNVR